MSHTIEIPLRHRGAGMNIVPELQVRQMLMEELYKLASDEIAIEEVVSRIDDLRQGTQEAWTKDLTAALKDLLDPGSRNPLWVKVGYPLTEAELPCISIVNDGGSEDERGAVMGDILDVSYQLMGTQSFKYTTLGVDQISHVQVGSWATAPELALLMDAAVRFAAFRGKGALDAAGVWEVGFTNAGFPNPAPELLPRVGYVPMTRIQLQWTYRTTLREGPVPNSARVRTGTVDPC